PAGHVGVKELFGNVYDDSLSAGIHIVNPLLSIHKMSIRTQQITEEANVPSREGLTINLDVSVLISLDPAKAPEVYKTIGMNYQDIIVKPMVEARGVLLERVLLRAVKLPSILSTAIEKKLEAEQQSEQMKFTLERERQEAERKRIEAKGISDFNSTVNLGLSDAVLKLRGIEATRELAKAENSKVIVIGSGKDGMPIILGNQ
ncbi:MAG: prohibitin family protein, partial [Deltaproteobacteria bacterium]|nr:prohibitin family protein [Deltaproteobacteria bacterium]